MGRVYGWTIAFAMLAIGLIAGKYIATPEEQLPLFDTERFTRHVELAYAHMVHLHKNSTPPHSFFVANL